MLKKQLLIPGLASSSLAGTGLIGALLSIEKKEVTFKDQLINDGYTAIKKNKFGPKTILLREYYSDLENRLEKLSVEDWCKKQEKITEKSKESEQFKEFCFESIGSKIEGSGTFVILKSDGLDAQEWFKNLATFEKDFETESTKPSEKWTKTNRQEDFKQQCRKNEREPYIKEGDLIFKEVQKYCARKFGS